MWIVEKKEVKGKNGSYTKEFNWKMENLNER